jgi:hypothetical protein
LIIFVASTSVIFGNLAVTNRYNVLLDRFPMKVVVLEFLSIIIFSAGFILIPKKIPIEIALRQSKDSLAGTIFDTSRGLSEQNKYSIKTKVSFNQNFNRFQPVSSVDSPSFSSKIIQSSFSASSDSIFTVLQQFLYSCFIPSGKLSKDYFTYTRWRLCQRFVSATARSVLSWLTAHFVPPYCFLLSVFGTQALLLALGFKRAHIGLLVIIQ